jgi:hypothetical protein
MKTFYSVLFAAQASALKLNDAAGTPAANNV